VLTPTLTANIVEVLRRHAATKPRRTAIRFLPAAAPPMELSFGALDQAAAALAQVLRSHIRAGDRVLMFYPPGLDFVIAFFGVLYAGAIAVPLVPPRRHGARHVMAALVANAQPAAVLTTSTLAPRVGELLADIESPLHPLASDKLDLEQRCDQLALPAPDAVCVLQYTSGSTGTPRGVMVTHDNIARNSLVVAHTAALDEGSVWVSWVPHFHDLGLFGSICTPLYNGLQTVLMPPAAFVARPVRWLEAITQYGGTVTIVPNFAYDLCVRDIDEEECAALDLSRWAVAGCGAEPIRMATMNAFAERFARYGFRREALCPFYGLAEATLVVTGGPVGVGQAAAAVSAAGLRGNRILPPDSADDTYAVPSCGRPSPEHRLLVVDPETKRPCAPDEVGEIWIDGASTPPGYWNHPGESARTFAARTAAGDGPYLRTGDLGFVRNDTLYVAGRSKDVIIVRGQNIYPQDLEATATATLPGHPEAAAFALEGMSTDRPAMVIEQPRRHDGDVEAMLAAVRDAVWREHGIELEHVVLTRHRALPKTSSGKLQRAATRAALIDGSLPVIAEWRAQDTAVAPEMVPGAHALAFILELKRLSPTAQCLAIEDYLVGVVNELLGTCVDASEQTRSLIALGMTSLAIMRLKRRIESDFMIELDAVAVWQEIGIRDLAVHLHRALLASALWANAEAAEALAAEIMRMTDEDVTRELMAERVA
jgi:acyl-CoA synthetase (AMP-forming)/AMP-acid ligase II